MKTITRHFSGGLLPAVMLALSTAMLPGPAMAEDVYLQVQQFYKNIPDGSGTGNGSAQVRMWGYRVCDASWACSGPVMSPGPTITMDPADSTLNIHIRNRLPGALTNVTNATSVVIPALPSALPTEAECASCYFLDSDGRRRVRSFAIETPRSPNSASVRTYTWTDVPAGTFLYHSGTHPQVQVQMGLYGAVVKNTAAGEAYPGDTFDHEEVVVLSEIDPLIHAAIDSDTYGTASGPTSTEHYQPRFFLINGDAFNAATTPPIVSADAGESILLRLVNAGIENHSLQLLGGYFDIIAEDGYRAPVDRSQHTTLLPAGKSLDVVFTPTTGGNFALFDRRLRTINDGLHGGGMFARIAVADAAALQMAFSTLAGGAANPVPGVAGPYDDADIYGWDGAALSSLFDATANGLPGNADIDGLSLVDANHFYVSFNRNLGTTVPGLGVVQDEDVVEYDNGTWTLFFDGSAFGLDATSGQDLDAISVAGTTLYFSTVSGGAANAVPGVAGAHDDADIYSWDGTTMTRVFDASANGLPGNADVDAMSVTSPTSFSVSFNRDAGTAVPGIGVVQDEDVVAYDGANWSLYFDGSAYGLDVTNGQELDAIHVTSP